MEYASAVKHKEVQRKEAIEGTKALKAKITELEGRRREVVETVRREEVEAAEAIERERVESERVVAEIQAEIERSQCERAEVLSILNIGY